MYDYDAISTLLHVIKETQGYPSLGDIHRAALLELQEINDEPKKRDKERLARPKDITPAAGPANAETRLPDGTVVQKPQAPVVDDTGRVDTAGNPKVPVESIRRNPDGTIKPNPGDTVQTVKVDPLDKPLSISKPLEPETDRRL